MRKELDSFWGADVVKLINEENRIRFSYKGWDKDIARLRELLTKANADVTLADKYAPDRNTYLELDRKMPGHGYGSGLPGYEATE
jgi:DNA topoisomerase VI subunit A